MPLRFGPSRSNNVSICFTERRYASEVYAMILCLSACVCLRPSFTSRHSTKMAQWIELIFGTDVFFDLSYTVL